MKNSVWLGVLSTIAVLGLVNILTPAKATNDALPVGTIIAWGGTTRSVPSGWMLCNGKPLSKSAYPDLFTAIGTSWGASGSNFNLPDLRGRFLRGDDAGAGRDPDAKKRTPSNPGGSATGVGSVQEDSLQNHTHDQAPHQHQYYIYTSTTQVALSGSSGMYCTNPSGQSLWNTIEASVNIMGAKRYSTKSKVNAGEETRPKNASVNFIIKVK
jgi:microcystin-dependent protein